MKKIFIVFIFLIIFSFFSQQTVNAYGGCTQYGIMAQEFGGSCQCMSGYAFGKDSMGKTSCISIDQMCKDQYGYLATSDYLTDKCKCMSGYSFGKDLMGKTSCISDTQLCKDQYGYNATSDILTDKCKCNYGYSFGKDSLGRTQCVSLDDMCHDDLGYNSSYNSLSDQCQCSSGYIIDSGKCVYGNSFCRTKNGLYSSYNTSSKKCECDSGYTLDDSSQCVKKQNNVYFTVKELDTDNRQAIIKSDYDYSYYLITYNSGCYASSFRRYLNHQIVVNLGTDFYLDTWDKIVLQDDDETCDITHKEKVDSSFSLETKEENPIIYTPPVVKTNTPTPNNIVAPIKQKPVVNQIKNNTKKVETKTTEVVKVESQKEVVSTINAEPVKKLKWYQKIFNWFK